MRLNSGLLTDSIPGIEKGLNKINPTITSMATVKNSLGSDVEIKGTLRFQHEMSIDGKIEGEIFSQGMLIVGENGEIKGEIKAKSVSIYGKVFGNITVQERCELKSRAHLIGDLKAPRLMIEEGATFVGRSEVTPSKVSMMQPEIVRSPEQAKAGAA